MVSSHAVLLLICLKEWGIVPLCFSCSWRLGWARKLFVSFLFYRGYLMCHIALPINHDERGERQCHDEPDETQ